MTEPLEIRRLTYADLPQVIAVERRAFGTPWSLAMFVLELSKPSGICLAALREGRVVGYTVCSRYDSVWHLMNVAVDDRLRREGIATALIEHLFSLADAPGKRYTLEVRTSNHAAIRLYERFGFRVAGRRRGYYHDNREDAVIMGRTVEGETPKRTAPGSRAGTADAQAGTAG
jgi:ribosomal-protein-alanine N-acetyltransferase